MNNQKHYVAAISAFVIWGFFALPLRALQNYAAGQILYFRILFSVIILLIIIVFFKRKDFRHDVRLLQGLPTRRQYSVVMLTLAGGILLTANWLTFIYIVNAINIRTASFSYLICPVITAVFGFVLIKEKLSTLQWVSVGLCAASCILMGLNSTLELAYSFLTAITYALYLITQRIVQGFDRIIMLCVQVLFSFLILNMIFPLLITTIPDAIEFYSVIMIIAMLFTVLPLFLNLFALNKINSATIGILMYLNPLINFTIAFIVFDEQINLLQLVGYSIIIIALILFNYQTFRRIQRLAMLPKVD